VWLVTDRRYLRRRLSEVRDAEDGHTPAIAADPAVLRELQRVQKSSNPGVWYKMQSLCKD
jgi:hypothetical protein